MIFDFDHAETPAPSHADVCILGAGAAGVALATELAARGRRVVVLEGGGPEHESRSQSLYHSDVVTQPHRGIHHGRFRTLGGSTTRWGGQMLELQPIDFAQRAWVPGSGWPFPKSELAPFYERALAFAGLRRVERNDEAVWSALGLSVDPAAFARDALAPELAMLFSRWLPVRNVAEIYASTLRDSRRIELHTHASAVGFRLNAAGDRVDGVRVRGFSGRTVDVTANNFVICLGGIESARLLLQPSGDGSLPWQRNGVLGKHYQDHIAVNRIPVRALAVREPWKVFGYNTAAGFRYHNKLWLTSKEQERYETLNVAGTLSADVPASSAERDEALQRLRDLARKRERPSLAELARLAPHAAAIASGRLRERIVGEEQAWQRVMLTVHSEQSPQGTSSITLGDTRDALGLWRTRLDWRIADAELHTIRTYVRLAAEAFARNGFAKIVAPDDFFTDDAMLRARCEDSFHHMGATRMSASASDGVVDPELQLHGVANAYVCSSSVFPSSGFSNPTHTLLALSMRLADKLANNSSPNKNPFILSPKNVVILSDAKDPLPARSLDTARESLRSIHLPHTNATTSQLGFGCAYLLGPGIDREASRRVLDAAWNAGIRHFDAARLYGMGDTETLLGEFLRTHPEATVTTKFGVLPPSPLQRNVMRAQRLLPALAHVLPRRNDKAIFSAAAAQLALEASLRALHRERVDLFLLHEADAADLIHDDLLAWLHRKRDEGTIGDFGFGGEFTKIPALLAQRPEYVPVLQYERSLLAPQLDTGNAWCAYYRTFAPAARDLTRRFVVDPALLRTWCDETNFDLAEPPALAHLLLRATLDAWPDALQLFSSTSEHHIVANVEAATDSGLGEPARRLANLLCN